MFDPSTFRRPRNRLIGRLSELARPALRGAAALVAHGPQRPPSQWRRGLIIGHSHMGDVLYRTPSLAPLRALLPACAWSYLCAPAVATLLDTNGALDAVLPLVDGEAGWSLAPGARAELRARRFDVALCTNTLRHYPDFVLAAGLGIPNRVGFAHKGMSGLLTRPLALPYPSPFAAYFRSMVATIRDVAPDWSLRPEVTLTRDDHETADRCWRTLALGEQTVVACVLTTRQPHGNWPAELLLDALRIARLGHDFTIALCGSAADDAVLRSAARALPAPVHVVAGDLGLRAFASFLSRCAALLTLDTGPRHLANAVGTPVLFLRNLAHSRVEAGVYCTGEIDLAPPLEFLSDAQIAAAATRLKPATVAASLLDVLRATRPPG